MNNKKLSHTMKNFLFVFIALQYSQIVAQPSMQWQRCLGGNQSEFCNAIQATPDGGYIACGSAFSLNNGDVVGGYGAGDYWIVKLNAMGDVEWQKAIGGSSSETAEDIKVTSDGGYIVAGTTNSSNGLITNFHGIRDYWVVKLNSQGIVEWQKAIGGSNEDFAQSVIETDDGGFMVVGYTLSKDGDAQSFGYEYYDIWLVKIDIEGNIEWEKKYGGNGGDTAFSIKKSQGDGFYLSGETFSNDEDVSGNHGQFDGWVVKIDDFGNINWQRALGGSGDEAVRSLFPTKDGGCVITGESSSINTGQVIGHHGLFDMWVVKLNSVGEMEWQRPIGGSNADYGESVVQTSDGGYAIMGSTLSTNGDAQGHDGGADIWIVRLDSSGTIIWQKNYGGSDYEGRGSIIQSNDGSLVFCGETRSNDGDVSGNHGQEDFWVVKLSAESSGDQEAGTQSLGVQPNPAGDRVRISAGWEEAMLQVVICDALGRVALHRSIQNNDYIDLSTLPDGLYFLQAVGNSGAHYAGKVLKQRE